MGTVYPSDTADDLRDSVRQRTPWAERDEGPAGGSPKRGRTSAQGGEGGRSSAVRGSGDQGPSGSVRGDRGPGRRSSTSLAGVTDRARPRSSRAAPPGSSPVFVVVLVVTRVPPAPARNARSARNAHSVRNTRSVRNAQRSNRSAQGSVGTVTDPVGDSGRRMERTTIQSAPTRSAWNAQRPAGRGCGGRMLAPTPHRPVRWIAPRSRRSDSRWMERSC